MAILQGKILDAETQKPISGVSLILEEDNGKYLGEGTQTNVHGMFYINSELATYPNWLKITHVAYKTYWWELTGDNEDGVITLEPNVKELPGVVVVSDPKKPTTAKKDNTLLWGGLALLAMAATQKKQTVSGTDTNATIRTVAIGAVAFMAIGAIKGVLESLGLIKDKGDRDFDAASGNPDSYWHPAYYKKAPPGSYLITVATADQYIKDLEDAFGWFNDDEDEVIGVFRKMKTKSQISFLSDRFLATKGSDFLTWLKGGNGWPNDRLSKNELAKIMDFTDKLPAYKP